MKHYRKDSISRNTELRQTFLLILESLEHLDIDRLLSLEIITPKKSFRHKSSKSRSKKEEKPVEEQQQPSIRSKQLDLLDAVEDDRNPLIKCSSQPNLSVPTDIPQLSRRRSFPNNKDLLVNKSENDISSVSTREPASAPERRFIKTHARARSDTCAQVSN